MSEDQKKPMSKDDREKLFEDVRQKGVLDTEEREELARKLDTDFDAFLKEQIDTGSSRNTHDSAATEDDIDKLAEVNMSLFVLFLSKHLMQIA